MIGIIILTFTSQTNIFALECQGIDISEWQGDIDFTNVAKDGITVVYIRAGEGFGYEDPYFEKNYQKAQDASLTIGFYYYVTAKSEEEAVVQANYFVSLIKDKQFVCKPVMDFESFGSLSRVQINAIASQFMETVSTQLAIQPAIYSDTSNASLWNHSITQYPLWVADYDGLDVPTGIGSFTEWADFQYSDQGKLSGFSGSVDRDYFKETIFISSTSQVQETNTATYQVKAGDTLTKIAVQFGTSVETLVQLNSITNPNLIYAGELLVI